MMDPKICTVTLTELLDDGRTQERTFDMASMAELTEFFDEVYAGNLRQLGHEPYDREPLDGATGQVIGGFGVRCRNRSGKEMEVGIGRDWWFLIDLSESGGAIISSGGPEADELIFYLHGWHHTSLSSTDLISRDECLSAIECWLNDSNKSSEMK